MLRTKCRRRERGPQNEHSISAGDVGATRSNTWSCRTGPCGTRAEDASPSIHLQAPVTGPANAAAVREPYMPSGVRP